MPVFDFRDASLKGDRRWSSASRWTSFAPWVVLGLAVLAIVQIVLGVIWIVSIQSAANNLTFAQVIQPLIIPGLSFFNTIPSLHLHVLARSNKPLMAMIFSSIMALLYLASAIIFLPPCINGPVSSDNSGVNPNRSQLFPSASSSSSTSYGSTECPAGGSKRGVWIAIVVLQFLSGAGYVLHFAMATKVRQTIKKQERDEKEGRVLVVVDPEQKARREEEARQRWREIRDL